jgi:hypothetical protein
LATTAFVQAVKAALDATDASKAPLNSPALTGAPTAPTAPVGTNNTQLATTAFAQTLVSTSSLKWQGSALSVNLSAFGFGYYLVKTNWSGAFGLIGYFGERMATVYFSQIISSTLQTGVIEVNSLGTLSAAVNSGSTAFTIQQVLKIGG